MILCFVRFHDFNADHQPQTAYVTYHWIAFLQLHQLGFQPFSLNGYFVGNLMHFEVLQRIQASGYCQLIATEVTRMVTRFPGIKLFLDTQYRQWHATANRFRHDDDIRFYASVFEGKQLTRAGKTRLNFVDNQQNYVFLRDFANALCNHSTGAGFTPPSPCTASRITIAGLCTPLSTSLIRFSK